MFQAQEKGHFALDAQALLGLLQFPRLQPPRFLRRLSNLSGLSHEQVEQGLARGA